MPATRKEISHIEEGKKHVARFRHPLRNGHTVRFDLGDDANYRANLVQLNRIFLDETLWHNPPSSTSKLVRDQWQGGESKIRRKGGIVRKGSQDSEATAHALAVMTAERDGLDRRVSELVKQIETLTRELEHWRGKKLASGPRPTLRMACDGFMKSYVGKDADATKSIGYDLEKFVAAFGPKTTVDKLEGREVDLSTWIRAKRNKQGKLLSASRRNQIRLYVLQMLTHAGAVIDRKAIKPASKKEIKANRGAIRWLSREDAGALAQKLSTPWREMFQIQVAIGLRPDELLTLHKNNFNADFSRLNIEPLAHLSLKTGTRVIPIPVSIRPLIEARIKWTGDVLFPEPETGKPWGNPKHFNGRFRYALTQAATAAGITLKMDARIGRRTAASLLLQDGVSAEKIAKLLGNTPGMILEHYGDPDVEKLDLEKNVVGCGKEDEKTTATKAVS